MAYSYQIFDSIERLDRTEWRRVKASSDAAIFADLRFIAALEASMSEVARFWYIIVYDEDGVPVACTIASTMTIDIAHLSDRRLARMIRHIPLLSSRFRKVKLLIAGLPVGTGHNTLMLTQRSASVRVIPVLDKVIHDLAIEIGADAIAYKEFGERDLAWITPLLDLGYYRIPTPPTYFFKPDFESFSQYCDALKSHYRRQINRSRRKLSEGGLDSVTLIDPQDILQAYTPEVHRLYVEMGSRAAIKFEVLSIEFLHQLALRLKGQVELLAIRKGARIVAFGWCIHDRSSYHAMYAGLDYELNREFDLYFNLMYAMLDRALTRGVSTIAVGLGGDAFKTKIGCFSEPLYVFAKGRGPLMSFIVRTLRHSLTARQPTSFAPDIFRSR